MNLKENLHLKEVEKILDSWDTVKGYLTTNEDDGVDLVSAIDISKLGFPEDTEEEEIFEALELHYDGGDYYFVRELYGNKEPALIVSTCEEIFVTYGGELVFPDKDSKNVKLSKDDFDRRMEILVYSLEWMHSKGCFPSIYQLDYYGNSPTIINIMEWEEYKALNTDDNKQFHEVERLLKVIELKRSLENTTPTLGDIPEEFYKKLPKVLSSNDGNIEIMEVNHFDADSLEITFYLEELEDDELLEFKKLMDKGTITEGEKTDWYKIYIPLLTQSIQFIKEA